MSHNRNPPLEIEMYTTSLCCHFQAGFIHEICLVASVLVKGQSAELQRFAHELRNMLFRKTKAVIQISGMIPDDAPELHARVAAADDLIA